MHATFSSRILAARVAGSWRSHSTQVLRAARVVSGFRTIRFKMVRGWTTAMGSSAPNRPRWAAMAPGSRALCWLCMTPFGTPVVPLV